MVICLERGADLHMAQLMPLPLTVSCFCKIQIGFTFLVPAHLGSPGQRAVKRVCVCVWLKDQLKLVKELGRRLERIEDIGCSQFKPRAARCRMQGELFRQLDKGLLHGVVKPDHLAKVGSRFENKSVLSLVHRLST